MKHTYSVTGMTCSGCAANVERGIKKIDGVESVHVDLQKKQATVTMNHHISTDKLQAALAAYPYRLSESGTLHLGQVVPGFWADASVWNRASLNTLNCLIGCSIGDFGMILFLQKFYPGTSMGLQMILATIAGLLTSIALETILLKTREHFSWRYALQTAFSMSFISMIAMELVMNATDFMMTGGKAAFGNPMYWMALLVAMVAGFLAPLPYNYYKLKKFNKACH